MNNTTVKKNNTKKNVTKVEKVENVSTENEEIVKPVEKKKTKKTFKADDPIKCKSVTAGLLGMTGLKTGINYEWHGRGDVTEVEYQDLVAAIRNRKKHIKEPYFIIIDDEFLLEFPDIVEFYSSMYSIGDIRSIFTYDVSSMKDIINSLPTGAKETVKNIASSMIASGALDSISKIKALDEIFETDFMLMTELYK